MVVAVVALVVAMAGTGYAATQLPKNSVGGKQIKSNSVTTAKIKNNAVTGAKVKNGSLTGDDIDLAKLGTVPSAETANKASTAATATTASTASGLAPLEPTHLLGAPGEPPFENGSTNSIGTTSFAPGGFYKDHEGIVHLTGRVKTGESKGTIFVLPPGFRPAAGTGIILNVNCAPASGTCETVGPEELDYSALYIGGSNALFEGVPVDGRVITRPGVSVSLEGITFRAGS